MFLTVFQSTAYSAIEKHCKNTYFWQNPKSMPKNGETKKDKKFDETSFWTTFPIFKSWYKKRDQKPLKNLEQMTHSSEREVGP